MPFHPASTLAPSLLTALALFLIPTPDLRAQSGDPLQAEAGPGIVPGIAQDVPEPNGAVGVRVLDLDRLLTGSRQGQALLADLQSAEQVLERENQVLADELAQEERRLTELRPSLSPEEFRTRADDFDRRVEIIRTERARLAQELAQRYEDEAQGFFEAALPVLSELMQEQGIVALLRPEALIVAADGLDVTALAIERLDQAALP